MDDLVNFYAQRQKRDQCNPTGKMVFVNGQLSKIDLFGSCQATITETPTAGKIPTSPSDLFQNLQFSHQYGVDK
eukprot:Awhi_evm1s12824